METPYTLEGLIEEAVTQHFAQIPFDRNYFRKALRELAYSLVFERKGGGLWYEHGYLLYDNINKKNPHHAQDGVLKPLYIEGKGMLESLMEQVERADSYSEVEKKIEAAYREAQRLPDGDDRVREIRYARNAMNWLLDIAEKFDRLTDEFQAETDKRIKARAREIYLEKEREEKRLLANQTPDEKLIAHFGEPDTAEGIYFVFAARSKAKKDQDKAIPIVGGYPTHLEAMRALQAWKNLMDRYDYFHDAREAVYSIGRYDKEVGATVKAVQNDLFVKHFPELAPDGVPVPKTEEPPNKHLPKATKRALSVAERIANLRLIYEIDTSDKSILQRIQNLEIIESI